MKSFIEALETHDREVIRKTPKADMHGHSTLSMTFNAFRKWTGASIVQPPQNFRGLGAMNEYLNREINPYVTTCDSFKELLCLSLDDSINDGVTVAEFSIDIRFIEFFPGSQSEFIATVEKIVNKYKNSIDFKPELGISRSLPIDEIYKLAEPCIDSGIFKSIDLYGVENEDTLQIYKHIFRRATNNKIIKKAHVGEFSPPEAIKRFVEELELNEIQHGITAVGSMEVLEFIKSNELTLNICPASNVALGAVKDLSSHPMKDIFDFGVKITINTDDRLLFGKSLSDQYIDLYEAEVFTAKQLDIIRLQGLAYKMPVHDS